MRAIRHDRLLNRVRDVVSTDTRVVVLRKEREAVAISRPEDNHIYAGDDLLDVRKMLQTRDVNCLPFRSLVQSCRQRYLGRRLEDGRL